MVDGDTVKTDAPVVNDTVTIYALVDPEGAAYYVGQSTNPHRRVLAHWSATLLSRNPRLLEWRTAWHNHMDDEHRPAHECVRWAALERNVSLESATIREAWWYERFTEVGVVLANERHPAR